MLRRTHRPSGLTLTLATDPEPRNPRLDEDPLFHFITWTRPRLGDAHDWPSALRLRAAMRRVPTLIMPVKALWSDGKPTFGTILSEDDRPIGYAFATHEQLRLHYGTDDITPELIEDACHVCDAELLAYEEFLRGDVQAFSVATADGQVHERRASLPCGEGWAEFLARKAFAQHVARWRRDEASRRAA